jgi:2-oxoglutarate dehydrogenase E1 component
MNAVLARYPQARKVVWVQEEPRNQGAWVYLLARKHLRGCLRDDQLLILHARPHSASPAVGYLSRHLEQQQQLVEDALLLNVGKARTKAETGAGITRRINVVEETSAQQG